VLRDHETAPIDDKLRALFRFLAKVNAASNTVAEGDVAAVKAAGWSEEALYDAITVAALFRFYNTWIDATGVRDMPPEAYAMSGVRIAANGYLRGKPPTVD
jgi:alkylhydroperoxidase family enzyme